MAMHRVAILGRPGSGKSYLARRLAQRTGLPLIYLDRVYHDLVAHHLRLQTDKAAFKAAWRKELTKIVGGKQWITDGNYGSTFDIRLPQADTIILLDYPLHTSLRRLVRRRVQYHKPSTRLDMPAGWKERFNLAFYKQHVFGYTKKEWHAEMHQLLDTYQASKQVIILRSPRQAKRFLKTIR